MGSPRFTRTLGGHGPVRGIKEPGKGSVSSRSATSGFPEGGSPGDREGDWTCGSEGATASTASCRGKVGSGLGQAWHGEPPSKPP